MPCAKLTTVGLALVGACDGEAVGTADGKTVGLDVRPVTGNIGLRVVGANVGAGVVHPTQLTTLTTVFCGILVGHAPPQLHPAKTSVAATCVGPAAIVRKLEILANARSPITRRPGKVNAVIFVKENAVELMVKRVPIPVVKVTVARLDALMKAPVPIIVTGGGKFTD